jgi:16S rRNA (cytosine1402-N4)-methyltransferase
MVDEIVDLVQPRRGGVFVDCTVGLGGHARALLAHGATRLIGLDRDPAALEVARQALAGWAGRVELVHADYRDIAPVLDRCGAARIDGAVADLGVSSMQLEAPGRGFSFRRDDPLDMRMDTSRGATAADLLASVDETALADVIFRFGEERRSRAIARAIVAARAAGGLRTTGDLADAVRRAVRAGRKYGHERIDPATRTFQALRIWVNDELSGLDRFLNDVVARLHTGGRLAVIAFHSLEDRIVKHTFRVLSGGGTDEPGPFLPPAPTPATVRLLTRRPLVPSETEVAANPRARSAKLRAVERI